MERTQVSFAGLTWELWDWRQEGETAASFYKGQLRRSDRVLNLTGEQIDYIHDRQEERDDLRDSHDRTSVRSDAEA